MENKEIELKKDITSAEQALLKSNKDTVVAAMTKLVDAKQALDDYYESLITPSERKAIKEHEKALEKFAVADQLVRTTLEAVQAINPNYGKQSFAKTNNGRKLTYADAQELRKAASEGMKKKDIQEKFGVSGSAVNYAINYLQHKLHKGDIPYTPLVNKYYPLGAHYAEDNFPENADRYKVKIWTKEVVIKSLLDGVSTFDTAKMFNVPTSQVEALKEAENIDSKLEEAKLG